MGGTVRFRGEQQRSGTIEEEDETGDRAGLINSLEVNRVIFFKLYLIVCVN